MGPHRRWRLDDADIRISAAQRIGVPALRAARVENKIVKIPKNEIVVALGRAKALVAGRTDLEKDLAVDEQGEKLEPRKPGLPAQLPDLLRRGQRGQGGRNLRIANLEQCAGARRFQHHLVGAPPHVGETRQHEHVGIAKRRRLRPIIRNLRLDDDLILAASRAAKAVFQETEPRQTANQQSNFLVDVPAAATRTSSAADRCAVPERVPPRSR